MVKPMYVVATGAFALVAFHSTAFAQAFDCKPTETQPECHTRLRCKPDEELEDCKKRLQNERGNQGGTQGGNQGGNQGDRGRGDRGRDDDRGRGRDDDRGRGRDDDRGRGRDDYDDDRAGGRRGRGGGGGGDSGSRRGRGRGRGGTEYSAARTFGLGLELGEPSGLNGKYFLSDKGALDFGVGWVYGHYYYGDGVHIYGDYLHHPLSLSSNDTFELPLYIGGGLRFWDFDYCVGPRNDRVCGYGGSAFGLRVPIGIAFEFNPPVDLFIQIVPVLDFINGDYYDRYGDRVHFGFDFSIGVRFWFK